MFFKSLNRAGFSLMEIMVGIALVGIVGLGMASLSYNMMKASTTAEDSQEISSLKYEVDGILNNIPYCSSIMNPQAVPSTDGSALQLGSKIKAGERYGTLSITAVNLEGVTDVSGTGTMYHADVVIKGQKREVNYGARDFTIRSGFFYDLSAGNINSCIGSQISGTSCATLGGTMIAGKCNFCEAMGGTIVAGTCVLAGTTTTTTVTVSTTTTTLSSCSPAGTVILGSVGPVVPCAQWSGPALCSKALVDAFMANPLCNPMITDAVLCGVAWAGCAVWSYGPNPCCSGNVISNGTDLVCQ